jgi:hypothetical protein
MFHRTTEALLNWMEATFIDIDLVEYLETYLQHRGAADIQTLPKPFPKLCAWATEHNILGWDNFMAGGIGCQLILLQNRRLSDIGS